MTTRSMIRASIVATLLSLALATPTLALKPDGNCPNDAFDKMTYAEFIALEISVGAPQEILDAVPAGLAAIDANDDGSVCVMDGPDTPGHLGAWLFNVIDNTSHSQ